MASGRAARWRGNEIDIAWRDLLCDAGAQDYREYFGVALFNQQ